MARGLGDVVMLTRRAEKDPPHACMLPDRRQVQSWAECLQAAGRLLGPDMAVSSRNRAEVNARRNRAGVDSRLRGPPPLIPILPWCGTMVARW